MRCLAGIFHGLHEAHRLVSIAGDEARTRDVVGHSVHARFTLKAARLHHGLHLLVAVSACVVPEPAPCFGGFGLVERWRTFVRRQGRTASGCPLVRPPLSRTDQALQCIAGTATGCQAQGQLAPRCLPQAAVVPAADKHAVVVHRQGVHDGTELSCEALVGEALVWKGRGRA